MLPGSGRMTWQAATVGPLAGATCLWQDLDGLHVGPAPGVAPPTSILWGWRDDGVLVRMRLDGDVAFVLVQSAPVDSASGGAGTAARTVPWDVRKDGRVAAVRGPAAEQAGVAYEQVVADGIGQDVGPVTFIRPAGHA